MPTSNPRCSSEPKAWGTAAEILPIRELDGRRIGRGEGLRQVTRELQQLYHRLVRAEWGNDLNAYRDWLLPVN